MVGIELGESGLGHTVGAAGEGHTLGRGKGLCALSISQDSSLQLRSWIAARRQEFKGVPLRQPTGLPVTHSRAQSNTAPLDR